MQTIHDFIRDHNVTMSCRWADRNPHMMADDEWSRSASHYKCTLRCGRRRMTVHFSQGSAHTSEPDAASVLSSLAMDASGYENSRSFEDWAGEYGYDVDSRKAHATYKVVAKQSAALKKLCGSQAAYEMLIWNTESL